MPALQKSSGAVDGRSACCLPQGMTITEGMKKIAIVGNPNGGKSVLFNNVTKHYVIASNYPGTSVAVSRGVFRTEDREFEFIERRHDSRQQSCSKKTKGEKKQ